MGVAHTKGEEVSDKSVYNDGMAWGHSILEEAKNG